MKNIAMQLQGDKLVIEIDLAQDLGPSKSGKTILIASSEGNVGVPGREDVKLGLNVYRYPEPK